MLLNFSNHPLNQWSNEQLDAARQQFGEIIDLPFPQVSPEATEQDIEQLAQEYLLKIQTIGSTKQVIIHLMGELNFTYVMVNLLKQNGYTCVASTTKRIVKELPDNQKISEFHFVKFRKY